MSMLPRTTRRARRRAATISRTNDAVPAPSMSSRQQFRHGKCSNLCQMTQNRTNEAKPDSTDRTGQKILVVDDAEDTRVLYATLLSFAGLTVEEASDGEMALDSIAKSTPDLVVMDLVMPRVDSWETTRLIKSNPRTQNVREGPRRGRRRGAHEAMSSRGATRSGARGPRASVSASRSTAGTTSVRLPRPSPTTWPRPRGPRAASSAERGRPDPPGDEPSPQACRRAS
jgi:CheY-like chemotaxis protein